MVVCWVGSGMTNLPCIWDSADLRGILARPSALISGSFVVDDTDGSVAIDRTEVGIDHLLGKCFGCRRNIFGKDAFLFHDLDRAAVVDHDIEGRFAGA